jgi:hypothetical protein
MELDDFKSTWQSNQFITEIKDMTEIHKIIQKNMATIMGRITKRYGRLITSTLIGTLLFVIFFYTISDGFRESPTGLIMGVLFMLSITGFAWIRYQQLASLDYAASLNQRLQDLVAQRKRNQAQDQVFVVGVMLTVLVLPRLFNGRGFSNLAQPDVAIALVIGIVFVVAILALIRRSYQQDIDELQGLLGQLAGE